MPHGRVALKTLLGEWDGMLAPNGDVQGCSDADLVLLDVQVCTGLAAWAQAEALGRDEGDEGDE